MYAVILLKGTERYARERWEQVPDLVDYEGESYSLRAGPRQPLPTDRQWDPVAVYAPDELTEEEFQELYESHRTHVAELGLKY
ncbi:hypothetical protein CQ393_00785 [Stenotrophomonas sp. MYb238]|uniref:hypothetical protein n=1 Tax=Stenotrophomonas sp. MYb238 TaxID=2040281 RepID=UPI00129140D6|nr:hypothetical protein [Stenotrophomonas sp. MYb238]MQP74429.1 hypothetical protein [Stenotrophomonas sp. MYb238]